MAENIFHLVLARPEGAGPGTKGLSMFLVPKYLVDADGKLGERNGVYATNVEHKMGLKASTTCELTFGAEHPAVGTLVGGVHDGIRQMFMIIEFARMMVGTKAIATLSTGYLNALDYAKTRVQGGDLSQMANKSAPRVTIIHHPDVRRMPDAAEGVRRGHARARACTPRRSRTQCSWPQAPRQADDAAAAAINDLLLPVVKGVGSERAYEMLAQSLQTLGGSGYLQDYPIEQYIRDAKIDSLYEGTTAIQGMDLYFRKIVRNQGQALAFLLGQIRAFAAAEDGNGRLKARARGASQSRRQRRGHGQRAERLPGHRALEQPAEIYRIGLNTTRLLLALGDLIIGWLLARQAEVATAALDSGRPQGPDGPDKQTQAAHSADGRPQSALRGDADFYEGKIAAARFFAATCCPGWPPSARSPRATTTGPDGPARGGFLTSRCGDRDSGTDPSVRSRTGPRPAGLSDRVDRRA